MKMAEALRVVRVAAMPPSVSWRRETPTIHVANTTQSSRLPPTSAPNIPMLRNGALCVRRASAATASVSDQW